MLHLSKLLCGSSLYLIQYFSIFLVLWSPELYTELQMQPEQGETMIFFSLHNYILTNTVYYGELEMFTVGANHLLVFSLPIKRIALFSSELS